MPRGNILYHIGAFWHGELLAAVLYSGVFGCGGEVRGLWVQEEDQEGELQWGVIDG